MKSSDIKKAVYDFKGLYPSVKWINGKWFNGDLEITRIHQFIQRRTDCNNVKEAIAFEDNFIDAYGTIKEKWPELEIVKIAREKLENGFKVKELAYPFTEKELKILNYLLVGDPYYAVFFYGEGGCGKTTMLDIIAQIFNWNVTDTECDINTIRGKLGDLGRFNAAFEGKRLWIDDDTTSHWSDEKSSRFKPIVTNSNCTFEAKGQMGHNGQYRCKCLFACNAPIQFDLTDSGMMRRVIYYKKAAIPVEKRNKEFINKIYTDEELINIVAAALSIDMTDWEKDFKDETHLTLAQNNTVFKYGMCEEYDAYQVKCDAAGKCAYGEDKWVELKSLFGEWFNGLFSRNF